MPAFTAGTPGIAAAGAAISGVTTTANKPPFPASMTASLIALIATLRCTLRSRLDLEAEILALRHQLAVLHRQAPRPPRLRQVDRLLWVLLSRLWPQRRRAIQAYATLGGWERPLGRAAPARGGAIGRHLDIRGRRTSVSGNVPQRPIGGAQEIEQNAPRTRRVGRVRKPAIRYDGSDWLMFAITGPNGRGSAPRQQTVPQRPVNAIRAGPLDGRRFRIRTAWSLA